MQIRVQPAIFFLYWHTIFGTWVYHHESMYNIYSWSKYDLDYWPQGQIYTRVFDMSSCLTHNFCLLWLWHIILGTWVYHNETMCHDIQNPDMTLTFYLKVKFIVFLKRLHVRATAILSYDIRVSPWDNVSHIFMTSVWPWPFASISKLYFHHEFVSRQDHLCSLT